MKGEVVRFAGYAAVFDRVDRGGVMSFAKGAFVGQLERPVPLLWQHDRTRPIGDIEMLAEDAKGLRVIGREFYRGDYDAHAGAFGAAAR